MHTPFLLELTGNAEEDFEQAELGDADPVLHADQDQPVEPPAPVEPAAPANPAHLERRRGKKPSRYSV